MRRIIFEDHGQDFIEWVIDENNRVIECQPFQSDIWNGTRVFHPTAGEQLEIQTRTGLNMTLAYRVQEIVDV